MAPDGQRILFRGRANGKDIIAYRGVDEAKKSYFMVPDKSDVNWIRWAGNDRIVISVAQTIEYYMGGEGLATFLVLHDLKTKTTSILRRKGQGMDGDNVLFIDPDGQYLLLSVQKTPSDYPSVFRVTLNDGKMTEVVRPQNSVWNWFADDMGIVRIGVGWQNSKIRFYYRRTADENFVQIGAVRPGEKDALFDITRVVSGSDDGYVLSDEKSGRQALYKFNYRTRQIGDLVYGHDRYDVDDYWLNSDGSALEGLVYTDDRERVVWFDAATKKLQAQIDKAIPDQQAWVVSRSGDGSRMLILGMAPNDPGLYYLLDRKSGEMKILGERQKGLPPAMLATTTAVSYPARDGTDIPAYLTLPPGREAKKLPLIIYPHGGPYGVRDKLNYDAEVQLLANRGYVVLQPNYRGSGGYGTAFSDAGRGQIGVKMQDDLDDGMDWLVKSGTVDAKRVCVVGASYGGYAALWAVIRNPERYRCAASFAGVTDWAAILKYDRRFLSRKARASWEAKVTGDDTLNLSIVSPVQQASRLTRPVLIAHGDEDSIVPISQSKKLVAALKEAGNADFEYKVYPGEGHGFADPVNQKDWFDRLEAFLAKHNPAP
ncbi:alpha/beta hydrolase family protein [Sphingopyxis panaciterrae]